MLALTSYDGGVCRDGLLAPDWAMSVLFKTHIINVIAIIKRTSKCYDTYFLSLLVLSSPSENNLF